MCVVNVLLFNQIKTVCKVHIEKKGRTCIVKKTYVKPVITKKVSVKNVVSMACSVGGTGRSHCLRA